MKKTTIPLLAILFFVPLLNAQDIYTLRRCLEVGLEHNYDLRIVRNEELISDNNVSIGNAGYLPVMGLNSGYSGTLNDITQYPFDDEKQEWSGIHNQMMNVGLNVDWMVFDGFKMQTNYARLKELQQMGALQTRIAVENLISSLVTEYYHYVCQNINMKNLKAAVALSKERLRIVEARYNIGSMSRLDLQQARVDFNTDSSRLLRQSEVLHASRIKLNELMAIDNINQNTAVIDSTIRFDAFLEQNAIWDKTLTSNAYLLLSEKNKTLSELDYKTLQSRNYPYLKLNAGYGYSQNRYETGSYNRQDVLGLNYGLSLGFTVFDGMNRKREQKNAAIVVENRTLQQEQLALSIAADFSNIWMAYRNNIELVNLEKENLTTAQEYYEIAIARYKLGDLSGIELREAQNNLLLAEDRLLLAEYNTKLCEISLLQLSGQLNVYLE
ncbi:MAG: TolC family protein [Bacteroidales bacterium]|nr:TolC family protein [Bacteroidales bacterium]